MAAEKGTIEQSLAVSKKLKYQHIGESSKSSYNMRILNYDNVVSDITLKKKMTKFHGKLYSEVSCNVIN